MATKRDIERKIRPHYDERLGNIVDGIPAPQVAYNFMNLLSEHTGRNVIAYYSSFPNKSYGSSSSVTEWDISGFMRVMNTLDRSKGLDLIMQTPGGDPLAAEGIVEYLQAEFHGDIRVIVPYCAYSAGTLISCAAKSIILGKHSFLGPVDPQLGHVACLNIIKEFDEAREDIIQNPNALHYWNLRIGHYDPAVYLISKDAVNLGNELLNSWLRDYMFAGESGAELDEKVARIYSKLNSNNHAHGRHFGYRFCKELGLKVEELEADPVMQDLVLSLHHALEFTISDMGLAKLLMNQNGETGGLRGETDAEEAEEE